MDLTIIDILILEVLSVLHITLWLGFLFNSKYYSRTLKIFLKSKISVLLSGYLFLIIWAIIILIFKEYNLIENYIILILWYLAFVKWIFMSLFPKTTHKLIKTILNKTNIKVIGLIVFIIWSGLFYIISIN